MHNSQSPEPFEWTKKGLVPGDGPKENLLVADCIGCHSSNTSSTIITGPGGTRIPVVYNTNVPSQPLAAGNFYWTHKDSTASGERRGHSLSILGTPLDETGWTGLGNPGCGDCHTGLGQGCRSCHLPAHHKGGSSVGWAAADDGYYRFLGPLTSDNPSHKWGVRGYEDPDWQKTSSSSDHNEYSGEGKAEPYFSISHFCIGCHMDIVLPPDCPSCGHVATVVLPNPDTSNWDGYDIDRSGTSPDPYSPLLPIARKNIESYTSASATVEQGTGSKDTLMCLTCHRAHASPYDKMLRWKYVNSTWAEMPNESCKGCHSTDPRP